jgi:uncharacterized protein YndB with AHSA1/START domain
MSDLGTCEDRGDHVVLQYRRRLAHPIDRVWAALTEPEELVSWWGDVDVEGLAPGSRYSVTWLNEHEGERVVMDATITEVRAPELLEITGDPHGTLRFELRPDGEATELHLRCTSPVPREHRTSVRAGWHFHLDALEAALEGRSVDLAHPEPAWEPIHERYVAEAGSAVR